MLHDHGISISYDRVLEVSAQLGDAAVAKYVEDGVVCQPDLRSGLFTTAAMDNIDHNPTATTATSSFHGTSISRGTGMIASSSTFRPHPGRVLRDLFRLLDAVTALYGSTSLQQSSKGSCSLFVSGYNLRADCQWRTLVPPLNSGANAAPASVLALM